LLDLFEQGAGRQLIKIRRRENAQRRPRQAAMWKAPRIHDIIMESSDIPLI